MPRRKKKVHQSILDLYHSRNIADTLDEEARSKIVCLVLDQFDDDKASRDEVESVNKLAMDIAKQVMEDKTTPWPGAASVKYPLITSAAMQSAARMYPEVIRNGRVAETQVVGMDPDGMKGQMSKRVSDHLNFQLLEENTEWEPDHDKLLHVLPVIGTMFKKTYWDEMLKLVRSVLCDPAHIIVNNNIRSLETARRVSHIQEISINDIISGIRLGIYSDVLDKIMPNSDSEEKNKFELMPDKDKETGDKDLQTVIEQHRYLDLDGDGYEEPYIVTVHKDSRELLRIYRRFDLQNVYYSTDDPTLIWKIEATCHFTDYHYIPSPDGTFYSIGFGQMLYPLNETINTLINQLLDAGTLSNRQSGFIGKGFKTKSGSLFLAPGEWPKVDSTGDDIKKNIFPMPTKDPSPVLFQLLQLMVNAGKELTSSTDILQGEQPAQNAPATTVLALLEQGMKVHSAILKRHYRSLAKEFKKIARLNSLYLDETYEYNAVLATGIVFKDDYDPQSLAVVPVSDPSMSSDAQRLARANAILQLVPMLQGQGQQAAIEIYLEALQTPVAQAKLIIPPPSNAPSPQAQQSMLEQQTAQTKHNEALMKGQLKASEISVKEQQVKINQLQTQIMNMEAQARVAKMQSDIDISKQQLSLQAQDQQHQHLMDTANMFIDEKKVDNQHSTAVGNTLISAAAVDNQHVNNMANIGLKKQAQDNPPQPPAVPSV